MTSTTDLNPVHVQIIRLTQKSIENQKCIVDLYIIVYNLSLLVNLTANIYIQKHLIIVQIVSSPR